MSEYNKLAERDLTLEEMEGDGLWSCYLTVGHLLDFIAERGIPRDGKVFVERIHDRYFETGGWPTLKRKGEYGTDEFSPVWGPAPYSPKEPLEHLFLNLNY